MSGVYVWAFGSDIYGVGRTGDEARQDGLDQLGEWVGALDKAVGEQCAVTPHDLIRRGVTYEFGVTAVEGDGSTDLGCEMLRQLLAGRTASRVEIVKTDRPTIVPTPPTTNGQSTVVPTAVAAPVATPLTEGGTP